VPADMGGFEELEQLDLASNNFSAVGKQKLLASLCQIPKLKRLDLSYNRLDRWYGNAKFPLLSHLIF